MSTNNWQHIFRSPPLRNTSEMDDDEEEEAEEALRTFCTRMVLTVRSKLSNSSPRREGEQHVEPSDEASSHPVPVPRPPVTSYPLPAALQPLDAGFLVTVS